MHILLGEFDQALELEIKNENCDQKHRMIYLKLLTRKKHCQMIDLLSTSNFSQYNNLLIDVINQTTLSEETRKALSDYCRQIIRKLTIDVVTNQSRSMYKTVAYEITACFEMLKVVHDTETAYNFYNMFKRRFV